MEIFETSVFTKDIVKMLSDDEYKAMQVALIKNPFLGHLIPGGGGLRKLRWSIAGSGKSGGIRVIYYYLINYDKICLIVAYKKSQQEDLTKDHLKRLINFIKEGLL